MTVVDTPALAGSRSRARQILVDLPADLTGTDVVLTARSVLAAAVSFIDEIVVEVLVRRGAATLRVTGATDPEFIAFFEDRATVHDVRDRLQFDS